MLTEVELEAVQCNDGSTMLVVLDKMFDECFPQKMAQVGLLVSLYNLNRRAYLMNVDVVWV